jgi:alpha-glucosidase
MPHRRWWETGVVYQIYPRSLQDSSGNGTGDLAGIIARLDYLADVLGVDALWISPFFPSPMKDFGYDVTDYTDVDPLFGDLATFDRLLEKAHHRGLRIIIDWVPNHTSDQHPWFLDSRSSQQALHRDWYIWADAKPDGAPPNNWVSMFGGGAWESDEPTGQYYLHSFLKEQPDLNWRNPEIREAMYGTLRFWLDRGVDGFRIDMAHMIMKDPQLRDNPLRVGYEGPDEYARFVHRYDQRHLDMHGVFREINALLASYSGNRVAIGEVATDRWDRFVAYYGTDADGLHLPFNFDLIFNAPWVADAVRASVDGYEAALPNDAWPNYVLGNHDHPRLATRVGRDQARVGAMLLLTLRGTPTLYYGDELGMVDADIPPDRERDPVAKRQPGEGRDGCRTPMQWDDSLHAGFTAQDVSATWLPLNDDYRTHNVAGELTDPTSMLSLYRRLFALRKKTPALSQGDYEAIDGAPDGCFAYLRQEDTQRMAVLLNMTSYPLRVNLPGIGIGAVAVSTHLDRSGPVSLTDLELRADEGVVIELSTGTT